MAPQRANAGNAGNLPRLLFISNGLGWFGADTAVIASKGVCAALLAFIGGRIGWVIDRRATRSMLGAPFAGGIGLAQAVLKHVIHWAMSMSASLAQSAWSLGI